MSPPLHGIRVLELARILAGPWCGQLLADLGADVVKVERAGAGDDTRQWGPPFIAAADGGDLGAAYFHSCNRGKRCITADFESPEGRALVRRLAAHADVVVENFKVGGLARYGLDAASLRALNPRLVACSISGFGQDGPYAPRAGYDFLIQGMGGAMSVTGEPDGAPLKSGMAIADLFTGLYAANAIQAALIRRAATGEGATIDCALLDSQVAMLSSQGLNHLASGRDAPRLGNAHPSIVPYDVFPVADGHVIIATGNDGQFRRLCDVLGDPELGARPDYLANRDRVANRTALTAELHALTSRRISSELLGKLDAAHVPAGPINTVAQVFADPQVAARGMAFRLDNPLAAEGTTPGIRSPIVIDGLPQASPRPAPGLGQHADEILADPAWGGAGGRRRTGRGRSVMTDTGIRDGGRILVDGLAAQGVEHVFCVPGESYLAVLDALHDSSIALTVCRHEAGAAMMADAVARLTGRPGICMVTRGPGASNAMAGIHVAEHDSVPLIVFVGQVERGMRGRGAFQELDYPAVFGSVAKWAVEIDDPARIPEVLSRAFHVALQGRPGPVVIALPEDVLTDVAAVGDAPRVEPARPWPGLPQMAALQKMLWAAERPVVVLGGGDWSAPARDAVTRFAERFDLPVATSFRRSGLFDASHPNYAGEIGIGPNPKLLHRIAGADLVLLVGARMGEMPSQGYTLFDVPVPHQRVVHVHADVGEIGRVYAPALGIHAAPRTFAASLEAVQPPQAIRWAGAAAAARADYLGWTEHPPAVPADRRGVDMGRVVCWLRERLPADAIVANGAGNYAIWPGRFHRFRDFGTQLAPTSGSMGYGVPAAIGAKRLDPSRTVVAFAGDGCFLMTGQDFATAVQYGLAVLVIVVDNAMYGTIRMHQEREYPGRVVGTALRNPDFAAYARAFGGHGETVERTEDFPAAFARAEASGLPAILHVKVDPEAITPATTLRAIREKAGR